MRWVAIAMLAACEEGDPDGKPPDRVVTLDALPNPSMAIDYDGDLRVLMTLNFDGFALEDDGRIFCPLLDERVAITLAGIVGEVAHGGGWSPMAGDWICSRPIFELFVPKTVTPDDAMLVVRDSSLELRFPLNNVLAPRAVSHPDWTFAAAGETATFTWSPVTDLDDDVRVLGLGITTLDARVRSGAIEVPFPMQSPATGALRFVISADATCGTRCTLHAYHFIEHAAEIISPAAR